jgi:hypothetical protein
MDIFFPTIYGKNLNKEKITIPDDFLKNSNIFIVAFQRWHQALVDATITFLEEKNLHLHHHIIEIPIIQKTTWFRQVRLDSIMRMGIKDSNTRQRTITVYLDKKEFKDKLNISNEESIHWFLVGPNSKKIIMRGHGVISFEEVNEILNLSN